MPHTVLKTFCESRLGRREFKYLVHPEIVAPLRAAVRTVCRPDPYGGADGTYRVRSLYLDTDAFDLFLANEREQADRFKARIRCYPDAPGSPVFLEIKRRIVDTVSKTRAPVAPADWRRIVASPAGLAVLRRNPQTIGDPRVVLETERFLALVYTYHLAPRLLVEYVREAYWSDLDAYARATFDTRIACQVEHRFELDADPRRWRFVEQPMRTSMEPAFTVLELKFGTTAPPWMTALVRRFDLLRYSFSKYGHGLQAQRALPEPRVARAHRE